MENNFDDLRAEFDKFVQDKCSLKPDENQGHNPDEGDEADNEFTPQFVDNITENLLAPSLSGVYLSRLDIKRVAEAIDESIPIKERVKMIRALFRHTTRKEYLRTAFDEFNRHINGRILIYQELSEAFPASKPVFDGYISKAKKLNIVFDHVVEDFEEIEPTDDPMMV
jgi:hypothetical protein